MSSTKHEYAFDVRLQAVIRVKATSIKQARKHMRQVVDAADAKSLPPSVQLTEFSLSEDGELDNEQPFEIDGEELS